MAEGGWNPKTGFRRTIRAEGPMTMSCQATGDLDLAKDPQRATTSPGFYSLQLGTVQLHSALSHPGSRPSRSHRILLLVLGTPNCGNQEDGL